MLFMRRPEAAEVWSMIFASVWRVVPAPASKRPRLPRASSCPTSCQRLLLEELAVVVRLGARFSLSGRTPAPSASASSTSAVANCSRFAGSVRSAGLLCVGQRRRLQPRLHHLVGAEQLDVLLVPVAQAVLARRRARRRRSSSSASKAALSPAAASSPSSSHVHVAPGALHVLRAGEVVDARCCARR